MLIFASQYGKPPYVISIRVHRLSLDHGEYCLPQIGPTAFRYITEALSTYAAVNIRVGVAVARRRFLRETGVAVIQGRIPCSQVIVIDIAEYALSNGSCFIRNEVFLLVFNLMGTYGTIFKTTQHVLNPVFLPVVLTTPRGMVGRYCSDPPGMQH